MVVVKNKLQSLLTERGLSQEKFAREAELGVTHVSKMCRNLVQPKLPFAFMVAKTLGVGIEDVFFVDGVKDGSYSSGS